MTEPTNKTAPDKDDEAVSVERILETAAEADRDGFNAARRRIVSLRRIVALGDFCAAHPEQWQVYRLHYFLPELSHRQIAELVGISHSNVTRCLKDIHIDDNIYDSLPPTGE